MRVLHDNAPVRCVVAPLGWLRMVGPADFPHATGACPFPTTYLPHYALEKLLFEHITEYLPPPTVLRWGLGAAAHHYNILDSLSDSPFNLNRSWSSMARTNMIPATLKQV
jgi:hypothetical protein